MKTWALAGFNSTYRGNKLKAINWSTYNSHSKNNLILFTNFGNSFFSCPVLKKQPDGEQGAFVKGTQRSNCTRQKCNLIKGKIFFTQLECPADSLNDLAEHLILNSREQRGCPAQTLWIKMWTSNLQGRKTSSPTTSCSDGVLQPSPAAFLPLAAIIFTHHPWRADQTKADIVTAHLSHSLNPFFFLHFVLSLPPASSSNKRFPHWI